jgi:hypothetical protein
MYNMAIPFPVPQTSNHKNDSTDTANAKYSTDTN